MPTLFELPKGLSKMSSQELHDVSAALTGKKETVLAEYKAKQKKVHELITSKQEAERQERINADPEYWDKHQGIG